MLSQPTRAAWIEIALLCKTGIDVGSQPTRAAWIEMISRGCSLRWGSCRSPLGLRGLKSFCFWRSFWYWQLSQPTRAAWIEMFIAIYNALLSPSQPTRAAWIEICSCVPKIPRYLQSQPTRAAWIEMLKALFASSIASDVAAHSGCVD